ncbi:DUF3172 domain-containing protein [Merismopedia glauca]|uniref:DUF3172 domain-containing protein n=1 Tax=Merismopedia glauca CCAP 1448/3 TaxID=1296344 RepID=A0A2T1C8G2_9CYAN|nr:DUF3172 domain-containing protein [Merismopedia glauca]PSB04534.1 DUF3172 domain-containing protein [Merismopedia glauca CCAP 1448/3]
MKRRPTRAYNSPYTSPKNASTKSSAFNYSSIAILGGIFVLGIGVGIAFSTTAVTSTGTNVVSREAIDIAAPNADICLQYGASAMVMDTRLFVTMNPFNVYVAQPSMRPGCVLRSNNWVVLEERKLITQEQVQKCKQRINTFGFTGKLEDNPQIACIYQNEAAQNFFRNQTGGGGDTDNF